MSCCNRMPARAPAAAEASSSAAMRSNSRGARGWSDRDPCRDFDAEPLGWCRRVRRRRYDVHAWQRCKGGLCDVATPRCGTPPTQALSRIQLVEPVRGGLVFDALSPVRRQNWSGAQAPIIIATYTRKPRSKLAPFTCGRSSCQEKKATQKLLSGDAQNRGRNPAILLDSTLPPHHTLRARARAT